MRKSDGYCYVEAYGDGDFMNYLEGCDLILVGPQIRHENPANQKSLLMRRFRL